MPICRQCNKQFPDRYTIDGKQHSTKNRKFCLDCVPFKSKEKIRKQASQQDLSYLLNNLYRRNKRRLRAIKLKGGQCTRCSCSDTDVLTFHHIDADSKSFNLAGNWSTKNWERVLEELGKCVLLCHNCHVKLHRNEVSDRLEKLSKHFDRERGVKFFNLPSEEEVLRIVAESKTQKDAAAKLSICTNTLRKYLLSIGVSIVKQTSKCVDCGQFVMHGTDRCLSCFKKNRPTKIIWPSTEELLQQLETMPFTKLASKLGVSDNAIRKRIRNYPVQQAL